MILGNTVTVNQTYGGKGGAVYNYNGTFNMYSGSITGNTATYGNVFIGGPEGKYNLYSGDISENIAVYGGGVYLKDNCKFESINGDMFENLGTHSGGGIYIDSGIVNIGDSVINKNKAKEMGGGIYYKNGELCFTGNTKIDLNTIIDTDKKNNLAICKDKTIKIKDIDEATGGMSIGITRLDSSGKSSFGKFTSTCSGNELEYLFADDDEKFEIQYNSQNELELYSFYPLWVGGIHVSEHNKNDIFLNTDTGSTAIYNPNTQTLTLNNAIIKNGIKKDIPNSDYNTAWTGIYSEKNLNIILKGNNSIGVVDESIYNESNGYNIGGYSINYGIFTDDSNLTFLEGNGTGTLNIIDYSDGIKGNNITFNKNFGKLKINDLGEQPSQEMPPCAISATGEVKINGGEFDLVSELQNGITADKISINDGLVKVKAFDLAINATNKLNISDSMDVINSVYIKNETNTLKAEDEEIDNGYVTIKSNKKENPKQNETPGSNNAVGAVEQGNTKVNTPKTGDNIYLCLISIVFSIGMLLLIKKKS